LYLNQPFYTRYAATKHASLHPAVYSDGMLMVIFGAGASYDSSPIYPPDSGPPWATSNDEHNAFNRPPLAKDLFANRPLFLEALELFPQCKSIVPRLADQAITSG
jgi:hypothetical protein